MQTPEIILSRIDHLHEGLSQAVQKPGGAQFALMLSMIRDSQSQALNAGSGDDSESAALPQRNNLYTPELVGRLNQSLRSGLMGDVHLQLSWLDTAPLRKAVSEVDNGSSVVSLSQAAVLAKQYTALDEAKESRHLIAA